MIYKLLLMSIIFSTNFFYCATPQRIVAAHSTEITAETPIKFISILQAFMSGTFEVNEYGTILYKQYKGESILYQDTVQNVHAILEGIYGQVKFIKQGGNGFPVTAKLIQWGIRPTNEAETAQLEMERFYRFMTNQDFKECDRATQTEIIQNRDELKKAFMAVTTSEDVKAVAKQIREAQSKRLTPRKLVPISQYVPEPIAEDLFNLASAKQLMGYK